MKTGPSKFSRRTLLKWAGLGATIATLGPTVAWWVMRPGQHSTEPSRRPLLSGPVRALTSYEATVLNEVTGYIVPTDQDPGAKEAKVVLTIDQLAESNQSLRDLCRQGVRWLDHQSYSLFQKESFLDLSPEACEAILTQGDSSEQPFMEKVLDKLQYGQSRIGYKFFQQMRHLTIKIFYSHPLGWKVVGYEGPPQFSGNLDYYLCD